MTQSFKIGRNSLCHCGSNKKYKKCCLESDSISNSQQMLMQSSLQRIKNINSDASVQFIDAEASGIIKMSDIILEYADDLLRVSSTFEEREKAVIVAVTAWNISLLDEDEWDESINHYICHMCHLKKRSLQWQEMYHLILFLIEKKLEYYPEIDRLIMDYEIIDLGKNDFHLNIASAIQAHDMIDHY